MLTITQEHMSYDTALYLINQDRKPSGICKVEFADKTVEAPVRAVILQLPIWEIYRRMGYKVYSKHLFFTHGPYNGKVYGKIMHTVYRDIFRSNIENDSEYFTEIKNAFWNAINNIDDFGTMELNEYHCALSIVDLAEIAMHPDIQELRNIDIDVSNGTVLIKERLTKAKDKFMELTSVRGNMPNDALCDFLELNSLRDAQVAQVMISYGLRTEINDKLIRRPVYGSSLQGYNDVLDYAIDNQAARKNVYYSLDAIKKSQYWARKVSILMSILKALYRGDCGTDVLLPWTFTDKNYNKCFGKIFIPDGEDKPVILMDDNFEQYINKPVRMYSPITCKHTDGICTHCFGVLGYNHTPGINIGISCATNFASIISQLILSTKHFDQASPTVYIVPEGVNEFFVYNPQKGGIIFTQEMLNMKDDIEIGIFYEDINGAVGDLQYMKDELDMPEHKFSSINTILIKNVKTGVVNELVMKSDDKIPHLTSELLNYMKENFKELKQEKDILWIPISKEYRKLNKPVMRSVVYNNSMLNYVEHVSSFVEKDQLKKYKNASYALRDFSDLIFDKVQDVNIVQIEALLKAHLVESVTNFSIPVVTDPANVIFAKTDQVISERTISGQLVYEQHNKHFSNATTYLRGREPSPFDIYTLQN